MVLNSNVSETLAIFERVIKQRDTILGTKCINNVLKKNSFLFPSETPGGEGTPIHYLYGYVPPNGVVSLKLLI